MPDMPAPTDESTVTTEREVLTWNDFGLASRELAIEVLKTGFSPDIVVAVARGGLLLAGGIAYALGVKSCGAVNAEFYTGIGTRLPEPVMLPPLLDEASIVGKKVLLVDDVSDSGRTLAMVNNLLEVAGADVRTIVLYTKPGTLYEPTYTWRRTSLWITFPWSAEPPVQLEP